MIKPLNERNPVTVAIVGLVLMVIVGYGAYRANDLPLIGGGTSYTADFAESAGITSGNEVRVAGVKVGKVTGVSLDGNKVKVHFRVKNAWVGNASTVSIMIKTVLGAKYLAVDPLGDAAQDSGQTIPQSRTVSPYDVAQAFNELGTTLGQLDSNQLGASLQSIADTFKNTPPSVRTALTGLSDLSKVFSTRDVELSKLLKGTQKVTGTLASENSTFSELFSDGNKLLTELQDRRDAIHALLTGSEQLGVQLTGLISDNQAKIGPTLAALDQVTTTLQQNQDNLDKALALVGPYYRLLGNAVGNGEWFDAYMCGIVPKNYLPAGTQPTVGCEPPKQKGR